MPSFNQPSRIIITCSKWLSPALQQEIAELGFKITEKFQTGVQLNGTLNDCIRLNLNLRCASQILYSIKSFPCGSPEELYHTLSEVQWEHLFAKDGYFSVTSTVDHPTINNSLYANVKVKDAIADRFRDKTGERPNAGPELKHTVIHLFWREDTAEIFIDTSGETLAKHGYRKIPGHAPMMESLAAATILTTGWDRMAPFVNPMCGSGTIAIEAAMIASNRRPGLFRENYGFKHISGFDEGYFLKEKEMLKDQIKHVDDLIILGTDISEDAVNISRINAGAAGVGELVQFQVCDFRDTVIPGEPGVVFFNPEYGERMGDEIELEDTYKAMGDFLKNQCKGYMGYIFTGNLLLAKKVGLKPKRRVEFYTGKIDCRLLEYELYSGTRRVEKVLE